MIYRLFVCRVVCVEATSSECLLVVKTFAKSDILRQQLSTGQSYRG